MAKLYGSINYDHQARQVTRMAHRYIETTAETWGAIVRVRLEPSGQCEVTLTDKHGNNKQGLWSGNADNAAKERDGHHLAEDLAYCSRCDCQTAHENGDCLECRAEARAEEAMEYTGSDERIMKHCNTHRRIMTHVGGQCLACQEEARS